jgi:hypothetical protein
MNAPPEDQFDRIDSRPSVTPNSDDPTCFQHTQNFSVELGQVVEPVNCLSNGDQVDRPSCQPASFCFCDEAIDVYDLRRMADLCGRMV